MFVGFGLLQSVVAVSETVIWHSGSGGCGYGCGVYEYGLCVCGCVCGINERDSAVCEQGSEESEWFFDGVRSRKRLIGFQKRGFHNSTSLFLMFCLQEFIGGIGVCMVGSGGLHIGFGCFAVVVRGLGGWERGLFYQHYDASGGDEEGSDDGFEVQGFMEYEAGEDNGDYDAEFVDRGDA